MLDNENSFVVFLDYSQGEIKIKRSRRKYMMTKIQTLYWGDEHTVEMDISQAAAGVLFCGKSTQYQTADFKHNIWAAMETHLCEEASYSGDVDETEEANIAEAIENAVVIK
jgi:hypothetical protein